MPLPRRSISSQDTRVISSQDTQARCGRCGEAVPLSSWGKYAGVYCDACSGAVALERMGARPKPKL